jgi:ATP-dependent RNA helicase RhlE
VKNRKQTLFFSATMPKEIKDLASGILNNPERITINPVLVTTDSIKQELYYVNQGNKRQLLQYIIKRKDLDSIIVFTNTKDTNDVVSDYISLTHIKTDSIHR